MILYVKPPSDAHLCGGRVVITLNPINDGLSVICLNCFKTAGLNYPHPNVAIVNNEEEISKFICSLL